MTDTTDLSKRHIRSFVLRQGRVSPAQQRACDTLLPRFGIPYAAQPLDLEQAFGRERAEDPGDRFRHGRQHCGHRARPSGK